LAAVLDSTLRFLQETIVNELFGDNGL